MRPSTLVLRLAKRINAKSGIYYALKAFDCLDEWTRYCVTEDFKKYRTSLGPSVAETDPKRVFEHLMLYNTIFRTVFYIRCRATFATNPQLEGIIRNCSLHLPEDQRVEIYATNIGPGFHVMHTPVTIGPEVVIGRNVTVNVGNVVGKRHGHYPILRDGATLGGYALVLGDVEVGENAIVGAGAVCLTDVPPNCVYGGNPARLLHERTGTELTEHVEDA